MNMKKNFRPVWILAAGMTLWVATAIFAQHFSTPTSIDATTAKLVCQMVERYHISHHSIDDEMSRKLLNRFLKDLDPQKLYFLASEVEGLQRYQTELDDLLKAGDLRFGYDTFNLYLKHLAEKTQQAQRLIDADYDFTIDESMVTDPDELEWAKTPEELNERWRKRVKYELLLKKLDGTTIEEARKQLHRRYENIRQMMSQTEEYEKVESYLTALTHSFDPHSSYMSPDSRVEFRIAMELSLEGIGAALRWEDGYTTVAEVIAGGAADADGRLQVGDKIIGVAQGDEEFVDIVEMKLTKVVRMIRGKQGTVVRLQVKKSDTGETAIYALTRQKIQLHDQEVKGEILPPERTQGKRIGVVHIPSFYRDFRGEQNGNDDFKSAARDLEDVLQRFRDEGGVDGMIIDLRYNGGGALSEAIEITGLFIDDGPVVQVKDAEGQIKSHMDEIPSVLYAGPLVVLTNRLSASASEIFAGAIKDYDRGIIVGDTTTHGKGTVQNVMPVGHQLFRFLDKQDRGALKLTIQQFYRVNGDSTQNRGVPSDIVLPSRLDHSDVGESFLENAMAFDQIPAAKHYSAAMVPAGVVRALKQASQKRIAATEDFQKLQGRIDRLVERKNRKTVSLNEAVLKKEREAEGSNDDEVETKGASGNLEGPQDPNRSKEKADQPIFPERYDNDEVLRITLDYIRLLNDTPKTVKK